MSFGYSQSTTHADSGGGQCDGRNSSSDSFYYECQHQHYLGQDDCHLKIIIAQMRRMGLEYLPTFTIDLSIWVGWLGCECCEKICKNQSCFFCVLFGKPSFPRVCIPKTLIVRFQKTHGRDNRKQLSSAFLRPGIHLPAIQQQCVLLPCGRCSKTRWKKPNC